MNVNTRVGRRWRLGSLKEEFLKSLLLVTRLVLVKFTELNSKISLLEQGPSKHTS